MEKEEIRTFRVANASVTSCLISSICASFVTLALSSALRSLSLISRLCNSFSCPRNAECNRSFSTVSDVSSRPREALHGTSGSACNQPGGGTYRSALTPSNSSCTSSRVLVEPVARRSVSELAMSRLSLEISCCVFTIMIACGLRAIISEHKSFAELYRSPA